MRTCFPRYDPSFLVGVTHSKPPAASTTRGTIRNTCLSRTRYRVGNVNSIRWSRNGCAALIIEHIETDASPVAHGCWSEPFSACRSVRKAGLTGTGMSLIILVLYEDGICRANDVGIAVIKKVEIHRLARLDSLTMTETLSAHPKLTRGNARHALFVVPARDKD